MSINVPLTKPDLDTNLQEMIPMEGNTPSFEEVLTRRLGLIQTVLGRKAGEYVRGGDRYSNFKHAAAYRKTTPEDALMGMRAKHEISLLDVVNDVAQGRLPSIELLEEKIGDNINYLILLEGLLRERIHYASLK